MKFTILFTILILLASVQGYKQILSGKKYHSQSAASQRAQTQQMILSRSKSHAKWFSTIRGLELFIQNNKKAFTNVADDMPFGLLPLTKRPKLIHSLGMTAEFEFKSNGNHPYTGIFKGADNGILRFSLAAKPDDNVIIPAFAFKFFRDGMESANLFTMYGLTGQQNDSNVFAHDMTSHIPMINSKAPTALKLLSKSFQKVSDWPNHLGHSNAAQFDQQGKKEQSVEFPFRLVFHPTKKAHQSMRSDLKIDDYFFTSAMQDLKIDHLFEVYAQATPENDNLLHIGAINMKSGFTQSEFGDQYLYFQHQSFEEDLNLKPHWEAPAEELNNHQASIIPQYYYPDLEF